MEKEITTIKIKKSTKKMLEEMPKRLEKYGWPEIKSNDQLIRQLITWFTIMDAVQKNKNMILDNGKKILAGLEHMIM